MPRFWVAMRLMRALEESAERSTMRLSLVVLASVIWVLRVAFPWSAATAADVRATRQGAKGEEDQGAGDDCLDAGEKLRGHAAAGAGVQPATGDDLEGGALLREGISPLDVLLVCDGRALVPHLIFPAIRRTRGPLHVRSKRCQEAGSLRDS